MTIITKSQAQAADCAALWRARVPVLWIVTREEMRVEKYLFEAAASAKYVARFWDCAAGVTDLAGKVTNGALRDPGDMLAEIAARSTGDIAGDRCIWIMRDLPTWISGPNGAATLRALRNLARTLPATQPDRAQAVVIITPSQEIPAEIAGHTTVIQWPLPDRAEIAAILDASIASLPDDIRASAAPNGTRDAAIDAAVGLSGSEAQACYSRSLVSLRKIDPAMVANEKKRVIARDGLLQWIDPVPEGINAIGGLDVLKGWLMARTSAFSPRARAFGLPAPRGIVLVGVPGCGKTLTGKCISTMWQCPLIKLDMGALKSKFVGESEQNFRKALSVIEAIGRCVVLVDEIEKALQGATSGSADGGVSADALGSLLSWMQDRTSEAFVIATANNVEALPPELLRKGRFDEVFFVDLPNVSERQQIVQAALRSFKRDPASIDVPAVANACQQFTGSEISAIVPEALFAAFADSERALLTSDLIAAAGTVVPLAKTAEQKIGALRTWAKTKARAATTPETEKAASGSTLDLN